MLLFFQQLNYLVEQCALAFLATRVFLYRFAFSYKKKKCVVVLTSPPPPPPTRTDLCYVMSFGGLALLNASGFLIHGGAALEK